MRPAIHRRGRRGTSLATALALGLSGLLALPAAAKTGAPSDLVEACTDAPSAKGSFNDYNSRSAREKTVIDCLNSGYESTDGDPVLKGNGSIVAFDSTISRAQFAIILNRVADYLGVPAKGTPAQPTFADVSQSHPFYKQIEELFGRGLTNGAGKDVNDVDNDGNREELIYNPNGEVSYAQVLAFVHRLLTRSDAGNMTLPTGQSKGQANNLDCGAFNSEKSALDNAGFLITANTPGNCKLSSARGLVFDLIAVSFDQAVEVGKVASPHTVAPGSISLSLDKSSALTNETVTATVTVKDSKGAAVAGQLVEIFAVKASDAFDTNGNPKPDGFVNVANTGRYGTGSSPAQIDNSDPKTNASGIATTTLTSTATSGGTYDVYAFVGDNAVVFKDVKGSSDATGKQTVAFSGVPAGIVITSNASPRNTLKYATPHTVNYQLVDSAGQPVKSEGVKIVAELYRTDDCAGAPSQSAPCNGVTRLFAISTLTTDANGKVGWSVAGANDPIPGNGTCDTNGFCEGGGDKTIDRFKGTWDQNGNGAADDSVRNADDFLMTFLDARIGAVDVATMRILQGNNPNKADETGARVNTLVAMEAFVSDVYGNPAAGVPVQFTRGTITNEPTTTTGSNGIATLSITGPPSSARYTYTATVDANRDGSFGLNELKATSATGDQDQDIYWVGEPTAVATYASQRVVGFSTQGDYVDLATSRVRVPYDGGDFFDIDGDLTTNEGLAAFESALLADSGANDTLSVDPYQQGGVSTFRLTVNGSASPVAP